MTNKEIHHQEPEPKPKIGEMPTPKYMNGDWKGWVGIEAHAPNGELKTFIWFRNMKTGDLNTPKGRRETAKLLTEFKLNSTTKYTDAAIGPIIDLSHSDEKTRQVKTIEGHSSASHGVFIEEKNRPIFAFALQIAGNQYKFTKDLRAEDPVKYDTAFQKIMDVLPRPKAKPIK